MNNSPVSLHNVRFAYGNTDIVCDMSIEVKQGEFLALVGPSGCGKTTLLNLLAGELQPRSGRIECRGTRRTVHQQGGLLPWLTVARNVALSIDNTLAGREVEDRINAVLDWIGLREFSQHYPHELSGGMRQRVELGRALTGKPDVLLLDEPFSALDYLTRLRMRRELSAMMGDEPCTTVLVTHDLEEAAQLADRILVLSERPMRCCGELNISEPRPRRVTDQAVTAAIETLTEMLGIDEAPRTSSANAQEEFHRLHLETTQSISAKESV